MLTGTCSITSQETLPSALTPHRAQEFSFSLSHPVRQALLVAHFTGEETEAVPKKPAPNHC